MLTQCPSHPIQFTQICIPHKPWPTWGAMPCLASLMVLFFISWIYSNFILRFRVRSWLMLLSNCQVQDSAQDSAQIKSSFPLFSQSSSTELDINWLRTCFNLTVYTLINYVWNVTYLSLTLCLQSSNKSNIVTDWVFFCFMKIEFVFSSILVLLVKALDFHPFKYLKDLER